ncbi:MAG: GntR family transcriptional regulator [Planctomycetota bacterium]
MNGSAVPKYERVKRALVRDIESGKFPPGAAFPSEAQLLEQFDVSRPTLVRSLQELVAEGYLYRQQGKGTFVAERSRPAEQGTPSPSPAFTVFLSRNVAQLTGASREVQLRILRGVQEALGPAYTASHVWEADSVKIDDPTREFVESAPRGAALMIEPSFNPALKQLLIERGWVVWSVNEPCDDGNYVSIDQEHAGYLATRFLINEGRQRIALINGPLDAYWGFKARREGYERALAEAGVAVEPDLIREGVHTIDSEAGRAMMRDLLASGITIDGVVGASDMKTVGAMTHCIEAGVEVPEEIEFVSIDNTLADQVDPPLPAVAMPFEEMGYQAAIQARFSAERGHASTQVITKIGLQPTLVER